MKHISAIIALAFVAVALQTTEASPPHRSRLLPQLPGPDSSNQTAQPSPFTERILALQLRLLNVTHTTDAWLRRQRNRADSFVTIINRVSLAAFANSVQLVQGQRQQADETLQQDCQALDELQREERLDWVRANATEMGESLASCAALVHDDLDRLVKEQFYTYYRDLQTQSLSAKSTIFLGFEMYNPVTQQPLLLELLDEIIDQVDRSMEVYLRPEVEAEIGLVASRGQLIVDMATQCAYSVATYYSELVHAIVAQC